jgi:hypothetical protein
MFISSKKVSHPTHSSGFHLIDDVRFTKKTGKSSMLYVTLHLPTSQIGPYIFVTSFISKIATLSSLYPFMTQVSHPNSSTGLIIVLYNLN